MTAVGITHPREPAVGKWWWVLLVTGILWILIGLFVLQAHYESAVAIGYLVGFWLFFAGIAEFVEIGIVDRMEVAARRPRRVVRARRYRRAALAVPDVHDPRGPHRFLLGPEGHVRLRHRPGAAPRGRSVVDDVDRRDHRDRDRHLGDGISGPLRGAAHHLDRDRRNHPRHRRDRRWRSTCTSFPRRSSYEGATDRSQRIGRRCRRSRSRAVRRRRAPNARARRPATRSARPRMRTTPTRRSGTSTGRTTSSTTSPASPAAMFARTCVTSTGISIRCRAATRPSRT